MRGTPKDYVASAEAEWREERPDLDLGGMRVFARAERILRLARSRVDEVCKRFNLDAGELDVLAALRRSGEPYALRPTELFQGLIISSSGLTARLHRLEERKLVVRRTSTEDRRSSMVRLSAKGLRLIDNAFADKVSVENDLLTGLEAKERQTLSNLLAKLAHGLEEEE
ncbi:MAG: MarR family transcriptional regulator [Myxococcota bacterium]